MSQDPNSRKTMIYKNVLAWRGLEKLYLDEETADVFFVFKINGEAHKIPAHKAILAATSPAFHAMFYGSMKQNGDIPIVDATPEVFREFLQNFYRSTVKVTIENIPEVILLSKKYLFDDALNACAELCKSTLNPQNVCWGYEIAILFEQDQLQQFCEQMISENAEEIFRSNDFLNCKPNLLRRILQLDSLKCDETKVFNGCLRWAENVCLRKGLDRTDGKNLRVVLGDMFFEIRFGNMAIEKATDCYTSHEGLISLAEYKHICDMITTGNHSAGEFNPNPRTRISSKQPDILVCDRIDWTQPNYSHSISLYDHDKTRFTSNCLLHLIKIESIGLIQKVNWKNDGTPEAFKCLYVCIRDRFSNRITEIEWKPSPYSNNIIDFSSSFTVKPGVTYEIDIIFKSCTVDYILHAHKSEVKMNGGAVVKFHNDLVSSANQGLLTRFHFWKPPSK